MRGLSDVLTLPWCTLTPELSFLSFNWDLPHDLTERVIGGDGEQWEIGLGLGNGWAGYWFIKNREVQFLRHVINGNGIYVDPSKIEAVKNWKAPRTSTESCIKDMILAAQKEAVDEVAVLQKGLDELIEQRKSIDIRFTIEGFGSQCKSSLGLVRHEYRLITLNRWYRAEVGEGQLIRPELVQETTEKILQIKDRLKAVRDR
ncbi:hypothetical protein Tco_0345418 [Tanacetum coccineum]